MDDFGTDLQTAMSRYEKLADAPDIDPETKAFFLGVIEGLNKAWIIFMGEREE